MRAVLENLDLEVIRRVMDVNFGEQYIVQNTLCPGYLNRKVRWLGLFRLAVMLVCRDVRVILLRNLPCAVFLIQFGFENRRSGLHVLIAAPGFTTSEIRKHALVADGSQQGETPRDENKMMSAEECARYIYRQ
jgi:hypothetical protein